MMKTKLWMMVGMFGLIAACGEPTTGPDPSADPNQETFEDFDFPLEDVDTVKGDLVPNEMLPRFDQKFDLTIPAKFDLVDEQSPVRNQARRGVCSIFSTVGLMEHLYKKAGLIDEPDFSEHFLQWSAKEEARGFRNTGGSSARVNLDAIHRFGVVLEEDEPYQTSKWTAEDDADCEKKEGSDSLPTKCYTNGDMSERALAAGRYTLPRGESVSTFERSLKTYMVKNRRPVIVGLDFFYQAWSHGGSEFTVNQDNRLMGAVVFPSAADRESSLKKRAGHSILIVGWDDTVEFPRLAEDGTPLLDGNGNPVIEKGFYIFKNSWGTGSKWGSKHPAGPGYGYLSEKYVKDFGRGMSASLPTERNVPVVIEPETCGNGVCGGDENTSSCAADCPAMDSEFASTNAVAIPDNDTTGVVSEIEVDVAGSISALVLKVDISHSWIGDLDVILESPDGDIFIVREADGEQGENFVFEANVEDFKGKEARGTWKLNVSDNARFDDGELNSWSLSFGEGR